MGARGGREGASDLGGRFRRKTYAFMGRGIALDDEHGRFGSLGNVILDFNHSGLSVCDLEARRGRLRAFFFKQGIQSIASINGVGARLNNGQLEM